MEPLVAVLTVVLFLAAWTWVFYKQSGGRIWSPLWIAFSATTLAALFIVSGTIGYTLSKRARFTTGTAWSDTVIWWEIAVGIAAALVAIYFWRRGLRSIRTSH
jgi:hypothetical protein